MSNNLDNEKNKIITIYKYMYIIPTEYVCHIRNYSDDKMVDKSAYRYADHY